MRVIALAVAFLSAPLQWVHAGGLTPLQWSSWALLQAVPSPTFTIAEKQDGNGAPVSLRWQIVPFNYSWSANALVSPVSIFMVNPVRRHAGSIEVFAQPEVVLSDPSVYSLGRTSVGLGSRAYFPLEEYGEYLSASLGVKYAVRDFGEGGAENAAGVELGLYTLFGQLGLQVGVLAHPVARYSFSIYLKYY